MHAVRCSEPVTPSHVHLTAKGRRRALSCARTWPNTDGTEDSAMPLSSTSANRRAPRASSCSARSASDTMSVFPEPGVPHMYRDPPTPPPASTCSRRNARIAARSLCRPGRSVGWCDSRSACNRARAAHVVCCKLHGVLSQKAAGHRHARWVRGALMAIWAINVCATPQHTLYGTMSCLRGGGSAWQQQQQQQQQRTHDLERRGCHARE
jgi:hypothetical protein